MNLEKERIPVERDRQRDTERAGEIVFLHLGSGNVQAGCSRTLARIGVWCLPIQATCRLATPLKLPVGFKEKLMPTAVA
jgi:hypothetical protein